MELKNIDHTHPHTEETFGDAFRRGAPVAADGGERDAEEKTEPTHMEDVAHEPPTDGANRSFERGMEGRDETV